MKVYHIYSVIFYTRYIDDILIIYDTTQINLDTITHYANTINNNLKLCPTAEQNNRVSFLDLAITRNTPHLEIDIFRKPTTTDTTISYLSNHPQEQKLAVYRFLIDRILNLPLHKLA
jgi:nicotinic acid mononucleotide adenylyltransferase